MPWQRKEHVNRLGRLGRGGRVERALDDAGGAQGLRLDVRARACDREPGARYSGLRTEESSRCLLVSKRDSAGQLNRREYLGGESHLFQGGLGSRGAKSPPPKESWERKKHADQARCDPPCVNGCSVAIASVMC